MSNLGALGERGRGGGGETGRDSYFNSARKYAKHVACSTVCLKLVMLIFKTRYLLSINFKISSIIKRMPSFILP